VTEPLDDPLDVIERSSHYFLTRDDDGFSLWSVNGSVDEPVLTFAPDEDGEAAARGAFRRESRMGTWAVILLFVTIASAVVWLVAQLVLLGAQLFGVQRQVDPFGDRSVTGIQLATAWAYAVSSIGDATFTVGVGLSVVIWLHRRYRREG
jgi:hypothetical protein